MGEWFDNVNTTANISSPEMINSQLGVHFLGGGATSRANVYDINPIHVSTPKISAGCGGIDFTLGAINIASKDEIKQALKSIASNGVGYAFLLGIETVSPLVANNMKTIQGWANQLNAININSCELASSLVQGAWPKSQAASNYICSHAGTTSPLFDDLIQSKHGCRDDPKKAEAANQKAQKNSDFLAGNYNVAWNVLQNLNLDPSTKTLFLNLSGTIIKKQNGITTYPPREKEVLAILKNGGTLKNAYHIASNGIDIEEKDLVILAEKAWKYQVLSILRSLQQKICNERNRDQAGLSENERHLIQTTRFPIGSLLSLMGQWSGSATSAISLDECADIISFEQVTDFVSEVTERILSIAAAKQEIQIDGVCIEKFIHHLQQITESIQQLEAQNHQRMSAKHQVIDYLMNLDRGLREKERGI